MREHKRDKMNNLTRKRVFSVLRVFVCAAYAAILLYALIFRQVKPSELFSPSREFFVRSVNLIPFATVEAKGALRSDILIQLTIFAPLGFMLAMKSAGRQRRKLLLILPLLLSVFAEIMQYALGVGVADITDILCNSVGAALGFFLYDIISKVFGDSEKLNEACTLIMACVACFVVVSFAVWLL